VTEAGSAAVRSSGTRGVFSRGHEHGGEQDNDSDNDNDNDNDSDSDSDSDSGTSVQGAPSNVTKRN
jgi:hypothetical protein